MYINRAPIEYPKEDANAILNLSAHDLDSTIYPTKGKPRKGPTNAQNIIPMLRSATVAIYIVDAVSRIKAAKDIIRYFFTLIFYMRPPLRYIVPILTIQ